MIAPNNLPMPCGSSGLSRRVEKEKFMSGLAFTLCAAAGLVFLATAGEARATTYTFNTTGGTGGSPSPWSGASAWSPSTPVSSLDNVFNFTAPTGQRMISTNDLGSGFQLNALNLTNNTSTTNPQNLTIGGSSLNFVKDSGNVLPTITIAKANGTSATSTISITTAITVSDALTITSTAGGGTTSFSGAITNTGGITFNGSGTGTITLGGGVTSGIGGITVSGAYTVNVTGNNTYTGITTVSSGTLSLGNNNRISDSSNLVMSGGTFATGGFSETMGTLTLSTASSVIDLGSGASALVFSDSSGATWGSSISLSFVNFDAGVDSIRIGTTSGGLTETQLAQITINGSAAGIDSNGFLTVSSVPEPSSYAVIFGAFALAGVVVKRRSCRG